jgi:hypothetical protein
MMGKHIFVAGKASPSWGNNYSSRGRLPHHGERSMHHGEGFPTAGRVFNLTELINQLITEATLCTKQRGYMGVRLSL